LKGKFSYPQPNVGLYEFSEQDEDIGKFKAPTLRNIAVTAPYMHDGSIPTLSAAIDHYRAGGRTIPAGPHAGTGFDNPNKSEFVKSFELSNEEKAALLDFLHSLTDKTLLNDRRLSDPWRPAPPASNHTAAPKYTLRGEIVHVYPDDGAISLYHDAVPGFMNAMHKPYAMEFLVPNKQSLAGLKPGMKITAGVRKRGSDYILDPIRRTRKP
jgi:Cu/Ag efflux protein CusF